MDIELQVRGGRNRKRTDIVERDGSAGLNFVGARAVGYRSGNRDSGTAGRNVYTGVGNRNIPGSIECEVPLIGQRQLLLGCPHGLRVLRCRRRTRGRAGRHKIQPGDNCFIERKSTLNARVFLRGFGARRIGHSSERAN